MMKLLILGLSLLCFAKAWVTYEGYRVYKVTPESVEQVKQLRGLLEDDIELDVWKPSRGVGDEAHVMVSPDKRLDFAELMVTKGFNLGVHIENVGEGVAAFKAGLEDNFDFDKDQYNTVADTYDYMSTLADNCPTALTCSWSSIGSSYDNQDINVFTMSTGSDKEIVYIDSLTHSREMLSGSTVNNIIIDIVENYDTDTTISDLFDTYEFHFVPIVNPDGYAYALSTDSFWRKNRAPNAGSACIGTDLNRNFDVTVGGDQKWSTVGSSSNPCSDTYHGTSPASATETSVIQDYLGDLTGTKKVMISIHSYARMWLHPYGHEDGNSCATAPTDSVLAAAGLTAINEIERVGGQSWEYGSVCEVIYAAAGGTVDHAYANAGFEYSYTPELRGNSFNPPTTQIQPAFEETWSGIIAMLEYIEGL